MTVSDPSQYCPICGAAVAWDGRYPNYLCVNCVAEAVSESGRKLEFSNVDATGGYQAWYRDTGEEYADHVCIVRGVRCCADEAHFGGIVVQPIHLKPPG